MGLGMALHEESVMDREFGDYLNHDLAQYHVPACADIQDIDAAWVDEDDDELNPMGSKGIGEIGIVGTAAAVANAVFHATGQRVRDLPIRLDRRARLGAGGVEHDLDVVAHLQRAHEAAVGLDAPARLDDRDRRADALAARAGGRTRPAASSPRS